MCLLLNCDLDKNQIAIIISMIEEGANPDSLSIIISDIMKLNKTKLK